MSPRAPHSPHTPRTLRALLFSAVCVSLAALGHTAASTHDLPLTSLAVPFAATTALAWLGAARPRGPVTLGLGLLAAQGGLHAYFARAGLHTPAPAAHHTAPPAPALDTGALGTAAPALDTGAMIAAHLLAAALCGVWLARGETAFLRLAHAVAALAFVPLRPPTPVPLPAHPRPRPARRRADARRLWALLGHSVVRRGPPTARAPHTTVPGAAV
ncbi:hypothetical protein ACFVIM_14110 [Streptomyces sp. NPDC057638]|uniref:hypothetical protein n=1 Tax=Streptomyces sp. NPDC057638 TaxID=3346190 RepID=UPI0036B7EFA7